MTEITVDVDEPYAEMYDDVEGTIGEQQIKQQFESMIHEFYQQVQEAKARAEAQAQQQQQLTDQFEVEPAADTDDV